MFWCRMHHLVYCAEKIYVQQFSLELSCCECLTVRHLQHPVHHPVSKQAYRMLLSYGTMSYSAAFMLGCLFCFLSLRNTGSVIQIEGICLHPLTDTEVWCVVVQCHATLCIKQQSSCVKRALWSSCCMLLLCSCWVFHFIARAQEFIQC